MAPHWTFTLLSAIILLQATVSDASVDNITQQVFASYNKFMPAAFADFNADKHTDVIVIEDDISSDDCYVKVLLSYVDPPLLRPNGPKCLCPGGNVKSVVPGDFDGDGALDLMLLSLKSGTLYDVYIAWGDLKNLSCPSEPMLTVNGQPLMMDYNGDMIADLFGESENKTRSFWLFDDMRSDPEQVIIAAPAGETLMPLHMPSSHGFVDLDGDLAADLFVTAEGHFEIWTNSDLGFHLTEKIPLPDWVKVVGQTTFMDTSLRGHNDIICVFCRELDCSDGQVYVWDRSKHVFLSLGFSLIDGDSKTWSYPSSTHHSYPYTDTITLRAADYDQDGYPDLLITLLDSDDKPQVRSILFSF